MPLSKLNETKHKLTLKGGNPFKEQELRTKEDGEKKDSKASLLGKIKGSMTKSEGKVPRFFEFTTKQFNKLGENTQTELSSLTKSSLISKPLLSLVVAYRVHCYKTLAKHEQLMTKPSLDLVISQFAKIYNNPDMLAVLAECWPHGRDNANLAKAQNSVERMKLFISRLYSCLFDPNLHFDSIYPARSTPLGQHLSMRRELELKKCLMNDDQMYLDGLKSQEDAVKQLNRQSNDLIVAKKDSILFLEE